MSDLVRQIVTYARAVGGLTTTNEGAIFARPTAEEVKRFWQKIAKKILDKKKSRRLAVFRLGSLSLFAPHTLEMLIEV